MPDPDNDDTTIFDWIMFCFLAVAVVTLLFCGSGCTHTRTVYERVEVPVETWTPPKNIKPPAERPLLTAGDITSAEAEAHPKPALQAVGRDLAAALAWAEQLLADYKQLIILINTPAAEPTPPE